MKEFARLWLYDEFREAGHSPAVAWRWATVRAFLKPRRVGPFEVMTL